MSGLSTNAKKTQLMVTGGEGERIGSYLHEIEIVGEIEILGIKIDRELKLYLNTTGKKRSKKCRTLVGIGHFLNYQ